MQGCLNPINHFFDCFTILFFFHTGTWSLSVWIRANQISKQAYPLSWTAAIDCGAKMHPPCCHLIILSLHTQGSVALRAIGRGAWMIQQLGPVDVRFPKKAKGRNFRNLKKWTEIRSRAKPSRLWIEELILFCSDPKIAAICGCSSTHSYRKNIGFDCYMGLSEIRYPTIQWLSFAHLWNCYFWILLGESPFSAPKNSR